MKKYTFLFKPLFFIFSLLFATWLVLKIEKISPSDFGKYKSLFESRAQPPVSKYDKQYLKNLFLKHKFGLIDSIQLDQQLDIVFESFYSISTIKKKKN